MYRVICKFADVQDKNYIYEVGDMYPHDGIDSINKDRVAELASASNAIGKPLIEKVMEEPKPKKRKKDDE